MTLIGLLLVLTLLGVGVYLLTRYVPMAAPIKTIIYVVVVLFAVIMVLNAFGLSTGFNGVRLH